MNRRSNHSRNISDSTKSSSSAILQPFLLLLTKRSQKHFHNDTQRENSGGATEADAPTSSYLILIQHSFSLYHRIQLHDRHTTTATTNYHYLPKVTTPEDVAQGSTCGVLFWNDSFHRISETYGGSFILLRLAGTGTNLWYNEYNDTDDNEETNRRRRTVQLFKNHGVIVDASTDPLGWDSTINNQSSFMTTSTNNSILKCANCVIPSRIDDLQEFVTSLQVATQQIMVQRNKTLLDEERHGHIPIMIDSISPLLIYHGVATTIHVLQTLRHWHWSDDTTNDDSTLPPTTPICLSPIITPVLKESLLPEHHRIMEDSVADAVVSLDGDRATIIRKSVTSGKVTKEEQFFTVGTTPHTSSSSSFYHTLIFHHQHDTEQLNINQPPPPQQQQERLDINSTKKSNLWNQKQEMLDTTTKKGKSLVLHHEVEDMEVQQKQSQNNMPRIFMQQDDIEFHDFDEDEPDDDLDL